MSNDEFDYYSEDSVSDFAITIDYQGKSNDGICYITEKDDSTIEGTLLSTFGATILRFRLNGDNIKLMDVMRPLNRWYIKRILKKDIKTIILFVLKGKNITNTSRVFEKVTDKEVILLNKKYRITYYVNIQ